jgi:transposase-like protein
MQLSKLQIQDVLTNLVSQEGGLNELLGLTLNALMLGERQGFLSSSDQKNKGNGYRFGTAFGLGQQIELRIPRDRLGQFKPVALALLREQESYLREVCFELYSKGLSTAQAGEIMEKIYGHHYSSSTVSLINKQFYSQMEQWRSKKLEEHYLVVYIDAIHQKVCRETISTEAVYVLLGLKEDYTREVIGLLSIPTESALGWQQALEDIKERGVKSIGLIVSDNLTGLDNAIPKVFKTQHQKCVVHFIRNVLAQVHPKHKEAFASDFKDIFNLNIIEDSPKAVKTRLVKFCVIWEKLYPALCKKLSLIDLSYYTTYLQYDFRIRRMIYTTNWIERLNRDYRRVLKIRGAMPNIESVLALLSKVSIDRENNLYKYPINNFKFEDKLKSKNQMSNHKSKSLI